METGVALSFYANTSGAVAQWWSYTTGDDRLVFQVELFAIFRSLDWIAFNFRSKNFHLYSNRLSSLQAIFVHKTKHPLVPKIKIFFKSFGHVITHITIAGNVLAHTIQGSYLTYKYKSQHSYFSIPCSLLP